MAILEACWNGGHSICHTGIVLLSKLPFEPAEGAAGKPHGQSGHGAWSHGPGSRTLKSISDECKGGVGWAVAMYEELPEESHVPGYTNCPDSAVYVPIVVHQ